MLIGDKQRFAVEFELDDKKLADVELKKWLFGRIRFWCHGEQVGIYEDDTTIRDVAIEAKRFLMNEGKRRDEALSSLSADEVAHTITRALYGERGQSDEQMRSDSDRFGRFDVTPQVDVFDDWRLFLVEVKHHARLIWQRKKDDVVQEVVLREGEFGLVLKDFLDAVVRCSAPAKPDDEK